jgi:hypothetical protein
LDEIGMFGREVGLYPRSGVLKLWAHVSGWHQVAVQGSAPLLGLRNEIVVGTVTRVVTVRMK